ncbi:hypothetical protein HU200_031563 [Digitaria exilis]|uniref:Protein kinase domain-containing protein n=1 Tax=Digitaria exilis TaxID=1010633 RepID=A0A835BM83_9POAL|nr:hypothetical protein HU200_031563 [Digitaria exilis]
MLYPAAVAVKGGGNCPGCGSFDIPYPFGIGPECSLPGFNVTCVAGEDNNTYLLLGNPSIMVNSSATSIDVSALPTVSDAAIAYSMKIRDNYSVHWTAPGRPFAISGSSDMSLYVFGCGVKAMLFKDNSDVEIGNCSVDCVQDQIMDRLPLMPCMGIGCCLINITMDLRAFTLNISRTGRAARLQEQVSAFIAENDFAFQFQPLEFDYDYWSPPPPLAQLSWSIPYQWNCARAMEDRANYACVSNNSYCLESPIGGYVCSCAKGFKGNPYVSNGCTAYQVSRPAPLQAWDTIQPKANCPTSCGNVTVAFPFGIEEGCFGKIQMYLICDPGPPVVLRMLVGSNVTNLSIDEGTLHVLNWADPSSNDTYPSMYAVSGEWGGVVLKWAVDNLTCKNAMASKVVYRCSSYSDCVDVTDDVMHRQVGYRCKCSQGFGGNPYIKDGCTDIDECEEPDKYICHDESASDGTKIFSLEELQKATNNFDLTRVVGRGGHGTVFKGILSDQRVVAIKRSKLQESTEIEQFINEVSILSRINHRNVVKLHGCCLEAEVPLLVYEFISSGTLYDILHREQNGILLPLSWEERLRIAIEVAGALMYLHSAASVSILHRDVKCMNILLNESYRAKVSDFGASRSIPIDQTHLVTAVQGTFGYLDPEYYHTGQLNEKSDVYSFGVILVELLMRRKPIFENKNGEKQNLSNYFLSAIGEKPLNEIVDQDIVGEASEEAIAGTARLAEECLSLTRGERPTMKEVEMRLQMLRARIAVPLGLRRGEEMCHAHSEAAAKVNGTSAAIPVPAGHHGTRQYSLEQEFVSSARVPR